ncbi:uncharacterized protein [Haliotis asinina]|uniref:uncharacterized protein n=1 Tax=Haliotis asinina TaxID=109174 RepID=UPI00353221F7
MELPKLILICPLLLYLEAFSVASPTDDVISTCTKLCQGQKVIDHCESLKRNYDKVKTVDHANIIFMCCLGYDLFHTGIDFNSYVFDDIDDLRQLVDMLKEVQNPDVANKYATCIRDCSMGGMKKWNVDEVKSCFNGSKTCPTYKCPA